MNRITCWECNKPSGEHRMGCGSNSRVQSLQWFLDSLHNVPQDVLDYVSHKIYVESLERKLNFDEENKDATKS